MSELVMLTRFRLIELDDDFANLPSRIRSLPAVGLGNFIAMPTIWYFLAIEYDGKCSRILILIPPTWCLRRYTIKWTLEYLHSNIQTSDISWRSSKGLAARYGLVVSQNCPLF